MFIYARYLVTNNQIGKIIIASPDTDVLIIACFLFIKSFFSSSELWLKECQPFALQCCPWHMWKIWCYLLHVSYSCLCINWLWFNLKFHRYWQKTTIKLLQAKRSQLQSLYDLGDLVEAQLNSDTVNDTIKFVIWLYDKTADTNQINKIHYKLFAQKKKKILKIYHQQKMHLSNTSGKFLISCLLGKTQYILWLICHQPLEMDGKNKTDT